MNADGQKSERDELGSRCLYIFKNANSTSYWRIIFQKTICRGISEGLSIKEEECFAKSPKTCLGFFMVMKKCQWELMGHVCLCMVAAGRAAGRNAGRLNFYI